MTIESEIRGGWYVSSEMKKVWAVELELLKKLLEVCNRHNLRIWAAGGTLLGAVREQGFIPWDDDIDMAMLRDDYDKLQEFAKKEFLKPFFFQSGYTERFPRGFARLRMDGTSAIDKQLIHTDLHKGIFIDIFVYDIIPNEEDKLNELMRRVKKKEMRMRRFCYEQYKLFHPLYSWKLFLDRLPIYIKGFKVYFSEYESLLKHHSGNDVSCIGFLPDFKRYRRSLTLYNETLYVPFEDIIIPIPSGFDKILRKQYGDYMVPMQAPSLHSISILDAEHSYLDYIPELRKKKKRERWNDRKNYLLHILRFKR